MAGNLLKGVTTWESCKKTNLGICPRDTTPFRKAVPDKGFLVPFNGLMPKTIQYISDWIHQLD